MADNRDKDHLSGVETTGHEWDGIKELNNPLPRWWLWVFYATIIWSIGYWVVYPSWPVGGADAVRGGTRGSFEWTQYKKLDAERAEILERREAYLKDFRSTPLSEVQNHPALFAFAQAGGQIAFKDNCASCHGTGGQGAPGYPNLNDDDWLWGGTLDAIYQTIQYGVRMHDEARSSEMPAFGAMLDAPALDALAEYVVALSTGNARTSAETIGEAELAALPQGERLFRENCASCHGYDAKGMQAIGAPNLADAIWLKSDGSKDAIISQMKHPKHGQMPAWIDRLDDDTIRQLTIYVHSLGGGE